MRTQHSLQTEAFHHSTRIRSLAIIMLCDHLTAPDSIGQLTAQLPCIA